jgi:phosphonate transport system ATP-binding protein
MTVSGSGAAHLGAAHKSVVAEPIGAAAANPALRIRELSKRYPNGVLAVDTVNLDVQRGELVALLGANGSGKSTVLRCAVRLTDPTSGSVEVAGQDFVGISGRSLREARRTVAMIFQEGHLIRQRRVIANVAAGALGRNGWRSAFGSLPREELRRSLKHLDRVGLRELALRRAGSLSGGQAQRVAIARALSQQPQVLLADEPVASLDPDAAQMVMTLLRDLAACEGLAILCVLHQPELALRFAHRVAGMRDGRLQFCEPAANLTAGAIATLYGDREEGAEDRARPPAAARVRGRRAASAAGNPAA